MVWREIIRLLEDPTLIRTEINHRLAALRESSPNKRRKSVLEKEYNRLQKQIERLLDAYQESLLSLEELRRRMPALHKREQTIQSELQNLATAAVDQHAYLRIADTIEEFFFRLRENAAALNVTDRQKILRLLVKEILVGQDRITIKHSIPVANIELPPGPSGGVNLPGYLLRSGSDFTPARESLLALCV